MKGWRLIDNHLRKRRESELAFRDALYAATLTRQDIATAPQFDSTARHMLHAWLFDEADLHNLPHQVPYLASCYLDRCLTNISMHNAQIFAEACLVIATKIVAVGGDAMDLPFDVGAQIEIAICQTLHWRLIMPTPYDLLQLHKQLLWLPPASMSRAVEYLRSIVCRTLLSFPLLPFRCADVS